jgi:hypothetical protein
MDVANIITELNNHGFTDTADDQKMFILNDTVWEVEAMEPWPFLEKSIALNTDGASPIPTNWPTDFKQVKFMADTTVGVGVWPERVETVRDRYAQDFLTNKDTNPFLYYLWGNQLRFYPIPPATTGRFYMDYIATQPALTSSSLEAAILMPPRHHRVYTLGTLYKLYALEDDLQNAQAFQSMFNDKMQLMREDLMRKQYQRPDIVFMTDADDDPEYYLP